MAAWEFALALSFNVSAAKMGAERYGRFTTEIFDVDILKPEHPCSSRSS